MPAPSGFNNSLSLYLHGHAAATRGPMSLFVTGYSQPSQSSATLFAVGSTASGYSVSRPLFLEATSGNTYPRRMNLFVSGPTTVSAPRNMNLWTGGEAPRKSAGLGLVAWNQDSGRTLSAPMYVSGDGSTPGALGEQRSMNLYLARVPSNAMSLYIQGPGSPANQQTTLFARGAVIPTGTMPLSMPDVVGPVSLAGKLYTHGF